MIQIGRDAFGYTGVSSESMRLPLSAIDPHLLKEAMKLTGLGPRETVHVALRACIDQHKQSIKLEKLLLEERKPVQQKPHPI